MYQNKNYHQIGIQIPIQDIFHLNDLKKETDTFRSQVKAKGMAGCRKYESISFWISVFAAMARETE